MHSGARRCNLRGVLLTLASLLRGPSQDTIINFSFDCINTQLRLYTAKTEL